MLTVHRAERADALLGPLCELLLTAAGDVFDPEIVVVPTRGVERWLAQQLALTLGAAGADDGVAATTRAVIGAITRGGRGAVSCAAVGV